MGSFPWQSRRRASQTDTSSDSTGQDGDVVGSSSFLPGDHTIAEVLEYVGIDVELAGEQAALERETAKPRSTLLAKLDAIAGDDDQ